MLTIPCPWCGDRDVHEFRCGGEAHIQRPLFSEGPSDTEWADYLFMRSNPKGVHHELWVHVHGCRRWFHIARDTVHDRILAVYLIDQKPPKIEIDSGGAA